jgi:hypothetical protein
MQQILAMGKYPVFSVEFSKDNTRFNTVDEIIEYLKNQVDAHPIAGYIGIFDHYNHTKNIGGQVPADMLDIKNILFCFGPQIPAPEIVAVRPRSIGVIETVNNTFIVNFMEAPGAMPNQAMQEWVASIQN